MQQSMRIRVFITIVIIITMTTNNIELYISILQY